MKLWGWVKSLSWVTVAGAVIAGALFAFAGVRSSQRKKVAENLEQRADNLLLSRTKKDVEKAGELRVKADAKKKEASEIREKAAARLNEMGSKDETLADIADRFNKRRVRRDADGVT